MNKNAIFTIANINYLPKVFVFIRSFLSFNPTSDIYVVIVGKRIQLPYSSTRVTFIFIDELQIKRFENMSFYYNRIELCTAVKPFIFEYLFQQKKYKKVIFFDPDIEFFSDINRIYKLLNTYNCILTPHIYEPITPDSLLPNEELFLSVGIYNGGFVALKKTKLVNVFLRWWQHQLLTKGFIMFNGGLFTDQKWLLFTPIFLKKVLIVKDPGYNVGWWNIHQCKTFTKIGDYYYINSNKLVFVHFGTHDDSGGNARIKKYLDDKKYKKLKHIYDAYQEKLHNVFRQFSTYEYEYDHFTNGLGISEICRRCYFHYVNYTHDTERSPFDTTIPNGYYAWLLQRHSHSMLPNYIYYKHSYDLDRIDISFRQPPQHLLSDNYIVYSLVSFGGNDEIEKQCVMRMRKQNFVRYYSLRVRAFLRMLFKQI